MHCRHNSPANVMHTYTCICTHASIQNTQCDKWYVLDTSGVRQTYVLYVYRSHLYQDVASQDNHVW